MNELNEFSTFREWMEKNPFEWHARGADLSTPEDFAYTLGRDVIPTYMRFLQDIGPLKLFRFGADADPDTGYMYALLTPAEIQDAFINGIVHWNMPEENVDFGYLMPFCKDIVGGGHHCFDMSFFGDDDLPVVSFDPMCAIPDDELKVAASFKYWLEKIVRFGDPMLDHAEE